MPHSSEQHQIIKEFRPLEPEAATSAGRLAIGTDSYWCSLEYLDGLFTKLAADAQNFDPPLELARGNVEVVRYAGTARAGTFGIEVNIPEGHIIPTEYVRVARLEER